MKLPWKKNDWIHYEFRRARWPEGITSWTYSRSAHPFMWMIFGNDTDGCTPWAFGKQWGWFGWWLRNRAINFDYCIMGLAIWKEGLVGDDAFPAPELEKKFWIGNFDSLQNDGSAWTLSGVRRIGSKTWRPYIRIPLPFNLFFHWGWKPTRGQSTCGLKKRGM